MTLEFLNADRRYPLDEDSYLVPELDGVRIFSRLTHEFLHEIPGEPSGHGCAWSRLETPFCLRSGASDFQEDPGRVTSRPRSCFRGQPGDFQDRFHGAGGVAAGGAEGVRGEAGKERGRRDVARLPIRVGLPAWGVGWGEHATLAKGKD